MAPLSMVRLIINMYVHLIFMKVFSNSQLWYSVQNMYCCVADGIRTPFLSTPSEFSVNIYVPNLAIVFVDL